MGLITVGLILYSVKVVKLFKQNTKRYKLRTGTLDESNMPSYNHTSYFHKILGYYFRVGKPPGHKDTGVQNKPHGHRSEKGGTIHSVLPISFHLPLVTGNGSTLFRDLFGQTGTSTETIPRM